MNNISFNGAIKFNVRNQQEKAKLETTLKESTKASVAGTTKEGEPCLLTGKQAVDFRNQLDNILSQPKLSEEQKQQFAQAAFQEASEGAIEVKTQNKDFTTIESFDELESAAINNQQQINKF